MADMAAATSTQQNTAHQHGAGTTRKHVYHISSAAYVKMAMHALKYAGAAVNGLLVGKKKTEKERSSGEERTVIEAVDAVPMLHRHLSLAPMMEIAMNQVDEDARRSGLCIVGYYHGNEALDDEDFGAAARTVADRIYSNCSGACAILLDNAGLGRVENKEASPGPLFKLFVKGEDSKRRSWHGIEGSNVVVQGAADLLLEDCVEKGTYRKIMDFDDHMMDISNDWLNKGLLG